MTNADKKANQTLQSAGSSRSSLPTGTAISHYRIVSPLGAGGMGEVYLAQDTALQRPVALKLLLSELTSQDDLRRRFVREAQTVASLDHPNIINIFEVAEHDSRPFFAMQYVDGHTLTEYIHMTKPVLSEILDLGMAICDGLQAAHDRGIVHRDLKPGNIMVDHSRRLYLLDFGLAAVQEWNSGQDAGDTLTKLSLAGTPIGTIAYMAPEQFRGQAVTALADIFALGIILYQLVAGAHPFTGSTMALRASSILRDEPRPLSEYDPSLPVDFVRIVGRCLKKNPAKRFQTARDIRNELEDLRESLGRVSGDKQIVVEQPAATRKLAQKEFTLGADLVRQLTKRTPHMIGDHMTYLDNELPSDRLVIYLHGMGLDERSLTDVLRSVPYRAIAPSLYGFDLHARHRIPLPLSDHSTLLRALMRQVIAQARPQQVLLVGVSSGADHFLHMLSADRSMAQEIDGLLLMGCNLDLRTCFNSQVFANFIAENPSDMLETVKGIGAQLHSLDEWLLVHAYLVQVMQKFHTEVDALRQYAEDIVRPISAKGQEQFVEWYRVAMEAVPVARFVFFLDETEPLHELLQRHLDTGALGVYNIEKTIIRENLAHMELLHGEVIVRNTVDMFAAIDQYREGRNP